ncbi:hypothetical protein ICJ04_10110 [Stenotrophomonas sp. 169]|uniref:Addiction module antidote protein n=1 Tax=Stenotrophomonas lacuserhaii TaxID=2760084 RepID=A0A8X8FTH2_9GAMM|nr:MULTISPECIES: hypothetical protein [Stenotrophomonas]MBD7953148.1 hypothetical protein [Stenotrophomonas pennii]MBD8634345.1 hypothetical protein [Stenotrophomonas sp. CFBP 13725]MBD8694772.1 hypothetical protein [Stenotrophomonas sp. CFBP 13718]QNR95925.1 hypothetical protein ICJ04_10110 [Stenotrophomonas sp. 169]
MNTASPTTQEAESAIADELNARLHAHPVDGDCLVAALLLMAEQRGISGVARSCGMSNGTFRRQFRNARGLPLSTVLRVLQSLGWQLQVQVR